MRNGKLALAAGVLVVFSASAATFGGSCASCGNSNEDRSQQTYNWINDYDALQNLGNEIKVGDEVKVAGGDGTNGTYQKYSKYGSVRWGCISGCGVGDNAPWFVPPDENESTDYHTV